MLDETPISVLASAIVFLVTAVWALVQCGGKKADKTTDVSTHGNTGKGGEGDGGATKKTETQTPSMMSSTKQPTTVKQPTQSVCQSQATTNKTQQQPTSQYNNTTGDPSQSQQPSSAPDLQKKPGTVTDDGGYDNLNPNSKPISGPIPQ